MQSSSKVFKKVFEILESYVFWCHKPQTASELLKKTPLKHILPRGRVSIRRVHEESDFFLMGGAEFFMSGITTFPLCLVNRGESGLQCSGMALWHPAPTFLHTRDINHLFGSVHTNSSTIWECTVAITAGRAALPPHSQKELGLWNVVGSHSGT